MAKRAAPLLSRLLVVTRSMCLQSNAVATIIEKAAGAVKTAATQVLYWISVA